MSIRSCAVHRTLLSKFKLYYYAYDLLVAVLTVGLSAQVSPVGIRSPVKPASNRIPDANRSSGIAIARSSDR